MHPTFRNSAEFAFTENVSEDSLGGNNIGAYHK